MPKWTDSKYGEGDPTLRLRTAEPFFFLRAQDKCAVAALIGYARALQDASYGSADQAVADRLQQQARDVDAIIAHFESWQTNNPEATKLPD